MHNLRLLSEKILSSLSPYRQLLCEDSAVQRGKPCGSRKGREKFKTSRLDGMIRVYIAIILLLLLLTVSQVCAQAHFGYEVTNL